MTVIRSHGKAAHSEVIEAAAGASAENLGCRYSTATIELIGIPASVAQLSKPARKSARSRSRQVFAFAWIAARAALCAAPAGPLASVVSGPVGVSAAVFAREVAQFF